MMLNGFFVSEPKRSKALADLTALEVYGWAKQVLPQDAAQKLEGVKGKILVKLSDDKLKEALKLSDIQWQPRHLPGQQSPIVRLAPDETCGHIRCCRDSSHPRWQIHGMSSTAWQG